MEPQTGALEAEDPANVTFAPPRNYTDGDMGYRLTVRSREAPAAAVVLNITVKNEADPTKKTIEDFMREMIRIQQENEQRMKEMQNQIDSLNAAGADLGGTEGTGE